MLNAEVANLCTGVFQNFIKHEGIYLKDKAYVYFRRKDGERYKFIWIYAIKEQPAVFFIKNEKEQVLYSWHFGHTGWHFDGNYKEELLQFMKEALCNNLFYSLEV
jgi:hypothetical protein